MNEWNGFYYRLSLQKENATNVEQEVIDGQKGSTLHLSWKNYSGSLLRYSLPALSGYFHQTYPFTDFHHPMKHCHYQKRQIKLMIGVSVLLTRQWLNLGSTKKIQLVHFTNKYITFPNVSTLFRLATLVAAVYACRLQADLNSLSLCCLKSYCLLRLFCSQVSSSCVCKDAAWMHF